MKKHSNCVRIYFSCFTKVFNIQNTQYSKYSKTQYSNTHYLKALFLYFSTRGGQIYFHVICLFCFMTFLNISAQLSMKTILMNPNLVRTFLGNSFWILIMVCTLQKNYFLVRTRLGYLRYIHFVKFF